MANEPRIYLRNQAKLNTSATSTHGGNLTFLFDDSFDNSWVSSGAASDATIVTIDFSLPISQNFDAFVLRNHNLNSWTLYRNTGSYTSIYSESNSYQDSILRTSGGTFTPGSYYNFRLQAQTTNPTNSEKIIGDLAIFSNLDGGMVDFGDLSSYDFRYREKSKQLILGDGKLHISYSRSGGRLRKYGCVAKIKYVTAANIETLKDIKERGEPVYWMPESIQNPKDVYICHWANPLEIEYSSDFKGAGFTVTFDMREV